MYPGEFLSRAGGEFVRFDFDARYNSQQSGSELMPIAEYTERRGRYEEIKFRIPTVTTSTQTSSGSEHRSLKFVQDLTDETVLDIKRFREQNSDKCMGNLNQHLYRIRRIGDSSSTEEEHRCVHKFKLNNREHLVPIKHNDQGQSVCDECNRPSDYLEQNKNGILGRKNIEDNSNSLENLVAPMIVLEVGDKTTPPKKKKPTKGCRPDKKLSDNSSDLLSSSFALRFQKKA